MATRVGPEPLPCNATREAIESFAADIAERAGIVPGSPLKPFVERLGGRLRYVDLSSTNVERTGAMQVNGDGDFDIYLSLDTPPVRNRFTIAHELGHYFLHYPLVKEKTGESRMFVQRYGTGKRVEWEANWFAAGLLMPKEEFEPAIEEFGGDIEAIARRFDVSVDAAQIRRRALAQ